MPNSAENPTSSNCHIGRRGRGCTSIRVCSETEIQTDITKPARRQGRYWFATIPYAAWKPTLVANCVWAKGQHERGEGGYEHWQCIFAFATKTSFAAVKKCFPASAVIFINKAS